jgi:hypothetical protein
MLMDYYFVSFLKKKLKEKKIVIKKIIFFRIKYIVGL